MDEAESMKRLNHKDSQFQSLFSPQPRYEVAQSVYNLLVMADESSGGNFATDIITYVGVPLAVLGILPIIYTTIRTVLGLWAVKRRFHKNGIKGTTRSDVISGIIECELPLYRLTPHDPGDQQYRLKASKSSNIPGGGWTILNWKAQSIGVHTQRFQFAEQLRQPAAEIKLEDLIYYLIDLGARPCPEGFRALRASGLWTPVGTTLLHATYPAKVPVLSVATSHDADGVISLALTWPDHPMSASWVGPRRLLIYPEGVPSSPDDVDISAFTDATSPKIPQSYHIEDIASLHNGLTKPNARMETNSDGRIDYYRCKLSVQQQFYSTERVILEEVDIKTSSGKEPYRVPDHLGVNATYTRGSRTPPVLFFTLCIAKNKRALWSYQLDQDLADFCKSANLGCGVLHLLNMVPASETPEWRKTRPEFRTLKYSTQYPRIGPKSPAWLAETDALNHKQDIKEALLSERWNVLNAGLWAARFLSAKGEAPRGLEDPQSGKLKTEILRHLLLYRMFKKEAFCLRICSVINKWEHWTKTGLMKEADYEMLAQEGNDVYLAWTILWMYVIASLKKDDPMRVDMRECVRNFQTVRLG